MCLGLESFNQGMMGRLNIDEIGNRLFGKGRILDETEA